MKLLRIRAPNKSLATHLLVIVLFKIAVLYGLWWVFIQPNKVKVNEQNLDCMYSSSSDCPRPALIQPNSEVKP